MNNSLLSSLNFHICLFLILQTSFIQKLAFFLLFLQSFSSFFATFYIDFWIHRMISVQRIFISYRNIKILLNFRFFKSNRFTIRFKVLRFYFLKIRAILQIPNMKRSTIFFKHKIIVFSTPFTEINLFKNSYTRDWVFKKR